MVYRISYTAVTALFVSPIMLACLCASPFHCALKKNRLNSALVTLVRKSNKDKLMAIKKEWERLHPAPKKQKKFKEEAFMDNDEGAVLALKSILVRVLRPSSSSIQRVIAATLHESSNDELPCWDEGFRMAPPPAANASLKTTDEEESCSALQICLFLGAVRDMLPSEHRCLRNVCRVGSVPLLNIRLGPIPEFTSKILTVTAFHHAHGRLHPAVLKLLQNQQQQTQQQLSFGGRGVDFPNASTAVVVPRVMMAAPFPSPPLLLLHFVCWVPLPSDRLSVRLEDRRTTRVLWCMVRCTVTSLWRSKVAAGGGGCHSDSSSSSSSRCGAVLSNRIMFVFQDGAKLTLRQEDLVRSMSEQHQAAPCEYQIMTMLRTKLDVTRPVEKNLVSDGKSASKAIWNHLLEVDKCKPSCLVDFDNPSDIADCSDTPHLFYSSLGVGSRQGSTTTTTRFPTVENESTTTMFMIVLPIYPDTDAADTTAGEVSMALWSERQRALVRVVRKKKIPVVPGRSIVNTTATSGGRLVMDQEASIITMVQHLGYQGRLLNLLLRT